MSEVKTKTIWQRYGYFWATLALFLFSIAGHWLFAWPTYVQEQEEHNQPIEISGYINQTARDTFENWQSEFLQLIWQVAGLAYLLHLGSPQSKEGDERKEEKIDLILQKLDPKGAEAEIKKLDKKFPRA
jgi:hypothetical protein